MIYSALISTIGQTEILMRFGGTNLRNQLTFYWTPWLVLSCLQVFNSIQSLSRVRLFATARTAACQASLSNTKSRSLLKFMFIELVMLSNHLILCIPLILPPSIFPSIRCLFKWVSSSHQVAKDLKFQHQFFQRIFRTDFF